MKKKLTLRELEQRVLRAAVSFVLEYDGPYSLRCLFGSRREMNRAVHALRMAKARKAR